MAAKKYYAARVGKQPGIYTTWEECSKNVLGFPGAVYKSFKTMEEAEAFMALERAPWEKENSTSAVSRAEKTGSASAVSRAEKTGGTSTASRAEKTGGTSTASRAEKTGSASAVGRVKKAGGSPVAGRAKEPVMDFASMSDEESRAVLIRYMKDIQLSDAVAFVDGSYNVFTKEYSYGMLIYHDGTLYEECRGYDDEMMAEMRNVAGEIEGSMHAMQYCIDKGIESVDIYYDYEGIEKWALGDWKTNKEGTKAYKKYFDEASRKLDVNFVKVKGHSGELGNERADYLAKKALGMAD